MSYCISVDYYSYGLAETLYIKRDGNIFYWEDLDVAKQNLQRIKEHYLWHRSYERYSKGILDTPEFVTKNYKEIYREFTHYGKVCKEVVFEAFYYIYLLDGDLKEVMVPTFWTGYWSRLCGAKIEAKQQTDWSFEI